MVLGTASHVGKSVVTAGFCRLLTELGERVAPFKAQNMALNSYITRDGGEIGRAQVAQAEAAGVEPLVEMNPILLKPMGGVSQVVVEGAPVGVMSAREYYAARDTLWPRVTRCYDRLARSFDRVVLEGAGSPVEVNLAEHDLTNLRMARHADAAVVIVADIERGGVFAQVVGTWELLAQEDRGRVVGFVINKFRGDPGLFDPGVEFLQGRTGVPVLGILPYNDEIQVDQEDSLGVEHTGTMEPGPQLSDDGGGGWLDVAVVRLPHLSNFTDFWPLARAPGVRVRYVDRARDLGRPDLVILPGTKATVRDLGWMREVGLAGAVVALAREADGPTVLGVCGGFQMLGTTIDDPLGVESPRPTADGLGLLPMTTRFLPEKSRHRVAGSPAGGGPRVAGYEIHMGETGLEPGFPHWLDLTRERTGEVVRDGAVHPNERVFGTYVHGLFNSVDFTAGFVNGLRRRAGLAPLGGDAWEAHRARLADRYGPLAAFLREHLDLTPVWSALGLNGGTGSP
jgi:adenosylcobyric acid synthase